MRHRAVLVENEGRSLSRMRRLLADFSHEVEVVGEAADGPSALATINAQTPNLVFLDIDLPGFNGFEVLQRVEQQPAVIFTTAYSQHALEAFKTHAIDYLLKPIDADALRRALEKLRRRSSQSNEAKHAPIVTDPKITELYAELHRVAGSNINVLLLGETGVGKEVFARSLHARSRRASGPFVAINCAALPETLLEAELFGHERGAFTGAVGTRPGLFESADGGTLFLDEIGELPLSTQAKLLRVLEDRKVVRVGGRAERGFDARFVAATNRDLEAIAEAGSFRADLYFRLSSFVLTIPPLRERSSELLSLARAFLEQASLELERVAPELAPEAIELLERYRWPGNVRELKNVMQRAAALTHGSLVFPYHLPDQVRRTSVPPIASDSRRQPPDARTDDLTCLRSKIGKLERLSILEALDRCAGNQTRAAQELGISRRTLVNRLQTYNLPRPRG